MKILVVDDSRLLRQRIIDLISDIPNIEISAEAESSIEAIKLIEKLNPDLMILDIRMPNGSGIEVLRSIRQQDKSIITIVLTNYPLAQYKEKCLELGASYFFDKVNEFEQVRDLIASLQNKFSEN
ncbi:MAG: response regulator transcription factor [Bacteroidales bacterium]|nr:response regulator transcription factor [Bacteroidales bacterium]